MRFPLLDITSRANPIERRAKIIAWASFVANFNEQQEEEDCIALVKGALAVLCTSPILIVLAVAIR